MEPYNGISNYHHERLGDPVQCIRLLKVYIDDRDSIPIHCILETHPMEKSPTYSAISYTWGDPHLTTHILINGGYFEVRYNCEYVLRQAYSFGSGCYYWCDAICINQSDSEEKSYQVAMMGSIFRHADQVLACVGEHYFDSEFLYRNIRENSGFLTRTGRPSGQVELLANVDEWSVFKSVVMTNRSLCRQRILQALLAFFDRPYFQRLWVFQELALATKVVVCCGDDTISIQRLHGLTIALLYRHSRERKGSRPDLLLSRAHYSTLQSGARTLEAGTVLWEPVRLEQAVRSVTTLQCADPRDKVYGVLSLVSRFGHNIRPDYEKDRFDLALEVLHNTARKYPYSWFQFAYLLAESLELLERSSYRLDLAIRDRMSATYSPTTMGPSLYPLKMIYKDERRQELLRGRHLLAKDERRQELLREWHLPSKDDRNQELFRGWYLKGHSSIWNLCHASTSIPLGIDRQFGPIRIWTVGSHVQEALRKGRVDFLLPSQVQSGDLCLFGVQSIGNGFEMPLALIARKLEKTDGSFTVIGRALITPAGMDRSPWKDEEAPLFHVHMDPANAMVLLCTETARRSIMSKNTDIHHPESLTDEEISAYLQTRVCGRVDSITGNAFDYTIEHGWFKRRLW